MASFFVHAHKTIALGWAFFRRDLALRYRKTILGLFWALAPVFSLGLGGVFAASQFNLTAMEDGRYAQHLFLKLFFFYLFCECLIFPAGLARRSKVLLSTSVFRYEALLAASFFMALFNLMLRLTLFLAFFPDSIQAPFFWGFLCQAWALAIAGLAIGAVLAPISLVFFDVRYALPYIQAAFFFLTPIFYELPSAGILRNVNLANPLAYWLNPDWPGTILPVSVYWSVTALSWLVFAGIFIFCLRYFNFKLRFASTHI